MDVILLTGLPGSGKSTWAAAYPCSGAKLILCPDDHLMVDGVYKWSPGAVSESHRKCMRQFVEHVWHGDLDLLILDSTNTRTEFLSPYIGVAQAFNHNVRVVLIKHNSIDSWKRNTHNVPEDRHIGMEQNLHYMMKYWSRRYPEIEIIEV